MDDETRRGAPAKLRVGEPLPHEGGLPTPDELECSAVPGLTDETSEPSLSASPPSSGSDTEEYAADPPDESSGTASITARAVLVHEDEAELAVQNHLTRTEGSPERNPSPSPIPNMCDWVPAGDAEPI